MREKLLLLTVVFVTFITLASYASSVKTKDGITFDITNDAGTTWQMTKPQILQKIQDYGKMTSQDAVQYGADQETYITWLQVEQMAQNAAINYQSNNAQ